MRPFRVALLAGFAGFAGVYAMARPLPIATALGVGCDIKGNVSYVSGDRIYHVPGQFYYADTVIDPARGERWFCSEAEARAAGWRRAGY